MTTDVRREDAGAVMVLTLDAAGRRNALSRAMATELAREITGVGDDVQGVVITGAGGTFSAGADFRDLTGTSADLEYDDDVAGLVEAISTCPVPVIAALEGPCMGAAAHVALVCDLRVAAEGSFLQVPAVRLGLLYSPTAVRWLSRHYPRDSVRRLLLLAERFSAADAREAGFVSVLAPNGRARDVAVEMLSDQRPEYREAVTLTRELLTEAEEGGYDDDRWQSRRRGLLDSPARAEAIRRAKFKHDAN